MIYAIAIFLFGLVVGKLLLTGDSALQAKTPVAFTVSQLGQTSEPLSYLFQLLFILFIISPPLIVVLLFLIWKELKDRNKMK